MSAYLERLPSWKSLFRTALFGTQIPIISESNYTTSPRLGSLRECPSPGMSCPKDPSMSDTCCINSPGGQFAQTQFWNSDPWAGPPGYLGPNSSWTIHGLWPDHCDGRYDSVCDCDRSGDCSSRNYKCSYTCNKDYSSITKIMQNFGQDDLLSYMDEHWKGINGNEHLWQHEWSKHGTCVSTLHPKCYQDYETAAEVVHYFQKTVEVYKKLPSFEWLAAADIVPSHEQIYDLAAIEAALKAPRGVSAVVGCQGSELREIWYHFIVRGNLETGDFVDSEPDFSGTGGPGKSCPDHGIKYLPKGARDDPTPTTTGRSPTGTSKPSNKGHFVAQMKSGGRRGCLISSGRWYNTIIGSSCASFTLKQSGDLVYLRSRKGPCGLEKGGFACSSGTPATPFKIIDYKLATEDGESQWFAANVPRGTDQQTVYTSEHDVGLELLWRS